MIQQIFRINLRFLRRRKKLSQDEFSQLFDLNRSTYSGYENGIAEPNITNLIAFAAHYQITIDDLLLKDLTKLSEAHLGQVDRGTLNDVSGKHLRVLTTIVDQNNEEMIEMIPEKARAGYALGYSDPEYLKVLPTFTLPFLSKSKKYRSFPIKGDSMPPVADGSYVIGEFLQDWASIKDGSPCIVVTKNEGIVFKIVYNMLEKNKSYQLVSTNPLFEPYMVHANEVVEIWKFVNYIASALPEMEVKESDIVKSLKSLQKDVNVLADYVTKKSYNN
jgi:transcriptional regulator with XRE-family HTH domain